MFNAQVQFDYCGGQINGGPHVELLRTATPGEVTAEVQRILASGVMAGKKFVLREGNNLAPHTPLENIRAMYEACKYFGRYMPKSSTD